MGEIIRSIRKAQLRTKSAHPFGIGDTVRVFVKVVEGSRRRLQAFEGTVMAKRNGGIRETFTVRRVSYGIGVERVPFAFPPRGPYRSDPPRQDCCRARSCTTCVLCRGKAAKIKGSQARVIQADTGMPKVCLGALLSILNGRRDYHAG